MGYREGSDALSFLKATFLGKVRRDIRSYVALSLYVILLFIDNVGIKVC